MYDDPSLLVVDDEEAICAGCRRILSRQGFHVDETTDAREGLQLAAARCYSAVLLDIKMPTMNGLRFLEELRKTKPDVPVILITGYPSISDAASAMRLRAADYVTKPFTPESITAAVQRVAGKWRRRVAGPSMHKRLDGILSSFEGKKSELIPILQKVQAECGCLPEEAMPAIARFAGVPESRVYAVATFYAQFRFSPVGRKHVRVCRGTSCFLLGARRILEEAERQLGIREGETTRDLEYSLETIACTGNCARSPCIMINDRVEARMTPRKVAKLLAKGAPS